MNTSLEGDFQICISVPLRLLVAPTSWVRKLFYQKCHFTSLLRALSALDPSIRVHTLTLDELLKLSELVANILVDEELDEFDM